MDKDYEPGKFVVKTAYTAKGASIFPAVLRLQNLRDKWGHLYADKTELPSRQEDKDN